MIALENVSKRGAGEKGPGKWILREVSLRIRVPPSVAVLGDKEETSAFLRLLTGVDLPSSGRIHADDRISYPGRYSRNLQPTLTGRQNATFLCRINGYGGDLPQRMAELERIAMLGPKLDEPVKTYTQKMKARLAFAMSWAFDFDIFVADAFNFAGPNAFGNPARAESELATRAKTAGFILTGQKGHGGDAHMRRICTAAIRLHDGQATWYDRLEDALPATRPAEAPRSGTVERGERAERGERPAERRRRAAEGGIEAPAAYQPALARIMNLQKALVVLRRGLLGEAPVVEERQVARLLRAGKEAGLELASRDELARLGCAPESDAPPVFKVAGPGGSEIGYFERNPGAARNNDEQVF